MEETAGRAHDFAAQLLTPKEEAEGDCFELVHRGEAADWSVPLLAFVTKLARWVQSKKKFRVIIDYDPEWTMLFRFRRMTLEESEAIEKIKPAKNELSNYQERLKRARYPWLCQQEGQKKTSDHQDGADR